MSRVCAWCKRDLPADADTAEGTFILGMCAACHEFFFPRKGPPVFRKYLDRLAVPVLFVDDAARVVIANTRACGQLAKEAGEIEGRTCGRVFDCSNAELPGGCGKTEFCRDCTVRQTIADTFVTGQCHENIQAVLDVAAGNDGVDCRLSISTWRAGEIVLLKIDRVIVSQDEKSETVV